MKRLFLSIVTLSLTVFCFGQEMQNLPNDPAVRTGKLENGLTYYIRHNDKPAKRAEFYLATNAGAIQEAPDQDGLAHFLEHMCFNGTKNFPGKGILNWLESIGASFGGNVNASTGIEQTQYMLNNIPLLRPTVVDTCILIMHDYSHFVTCDPEEIDKERGVIIEEKRSRNTASWRNYMNAKPYLFGDNHYGTCSLIGAQEQLETFKPESLVNFYKTWYQPHNQALIVVGDIDVDEVEKKIAAIFADIPAQENPQEKEIITIPDNEEPIVGIITDKETTTSSIEVYWKSEATPEALNSTAIGMTNDIIKDLITMVMQERLNDIASKPDAPFTDAGFGFSNLCETAEAVIAEAQGKQENILEAFRATLTEVEKMKRFGFTESEVKRAQDELLSRYETAAKKADTRKNSEFIGPIIDHFFDNYSFMDPAAEYQLAQAIIPQLTSQVLNQVTPEVITRDNMVVLYMAQDKEGVTHPTKEQILTIIDQVQNAEIEQVAGEEVPEAFLDPTAIKSGKIKKVKPYKYDSEELTLSNGMKVILLPTEYEKDRISINLYKKGGRSLISDADVYSFESNIWSLFLSNAGIAEFPNTTVNKMLAGKQLSVTPYISTYTHGINATSTVKDLETTLQLINLQFTNPRFDKDEYDTGIRQLEAILPSLESTPNYKLQNEVTKTLFNSPRKYMISQESVKKANLETIERVYRELFKDVAGAVMIVVGDFNKEEITPLLEKYIASLPKGKKATNWSLRGEEIVDGSTVNDFTTQMEAPKVTVVQCYKDTKPYSVELEATYDALSYILDMVYVETLREDEGGTYGASASSSVTTKPYEFQLIEVAFETNPDAAEKLRGMAKDGLTRIAQEGPTEVMYDKAVKNLEKTIPESKLRNSFWSNALYNWQLYGIETIEAYENAVKAMTPEKIRKAAQDITGSGNMIELIMRPE